MKLRKILAALLVFALVFPLVSCSQEQNKKSTVESSSPAKETSEKSEESAKTATDEPVKLTFSFWGRENEIAGKEKLVETFQEQYPNYDFDLIYTDGGTYPTKLQTFFASDTAPDVMSLANDVIYDFMGQDLFLDLKPHIETDNLAEGTWDDQILEPYLYEDSIIAVPQVFKVFGIVYNKEIFDAAGVEYPQNDWTEEEFIDIAHKLTSGEGVDKIYGMNMNQWMLQEMLRNFYREGAVYDVASKTMTASDNPAFAHALNLTTSLVKAGVAPSTVEAESIGGGFDTGRFGMSFFISGDIAGFEKIIADNFAWDILPFPSNKDYGPWLTSARVDGLSISSKSKHQDAAWEFIKWMTTDKEAQKASETFGIPTYLPYTQSEEFLNSYLEGAYVKYDRSVFLELGKNSFAFQSAGTWGQVNELLTEEYDRVILEDKSVEDAILSIQERGSQLLGA